ncbi:helix-turn-helix domain-containing protein [Nocardiopsis sp. ARC36]
MAQRDLTGSQITSSYISLIETGKRIPTLNVVVLLAEKLGMPLEALLGRPSPQISPRNETSDALTNTFLHAVNTMEIGSYEEALLQFRQAYRQARDVNDHKLLVQIGFRTDEILQIQRKHGERVSLFTELLTSPGIEEQSTLKISVVTGLVSALRDSGQWQEARRAALDAQPLVETPPIEGSVEHVKFLGVLISILCELRSLDEIRPPLEKLLQLAAELGQDGVIGRANWVASRAYVVIGDNDAAYDSLHLALEHLSLKGITTHEWIRFSRSIAGTLIAIERDLSMAEEWLQNAETAAHLLKAQEEDLTIQVLKCRLALLSGSPDKVVEISSKFDLDTTALPDRPRAQMQETLGEALLRLGKVGEGISSLREAARTWEKAGDFQKALASWKRIDRMTRNENED